MMEAEPWTPGDTFGARLALVRQHRGWNVQQASDACRIKPGNWHNWERGGHPRDLLAAVDAIVDGSGCDREWLIFGGALARSRCLTTLPPILGQIELPWDVIVPTLIEHSTPTSPLPTGMREEIEEGGPCTTSRSTRSTNYVAVSLDPRSTRAATN